MMHKLGSAWPSSDESTTQEQAMNSDAQHNSPSRKRLTLDAAQKLAEGNITPTQLLDFFAKMDRWVIVNNCMTGIRSPNAHAQQQIKQHDASTVSGNLLQALAYSAASQSVSLQRVEILCDSGAVMKMQP
jgi:hypothetical protein